VWRFCNADLQHQSDARAGRVCGNSVKSGEYQNASEAVRDAIRVLQQRRREDALKLEALRMQIKAGIDALDRGDFIEVDEADLDDCLEGLTVASHEGAR
jgi:antitoxin ParD1/3/4